ncbi:PTS glucitol/sorbitol transporter subunit IIA [Brooklawnia sp.]|uniref:PTS glucitol/sorbitol transporter subunit IIA n=1 Tax=Brooklawnia sp. TaxID=2699740 RepID=UPI00311F8B28
MSTTLWTTTIAQVGGEAGEMIDAGVLILFGDPVPQALADISIVHTGASAVSRALQPGDVFEFAGRSYTVDEVGGHAMTNLIDLGHIVLYVNQPDQKLLPGAIKVTGPVFDVPAVGETISFVGA